MKWFVTYKKYHEKLIEIEKLKRELTLHKLKHSNENYGKLILAVHTKVKGESRFQTALRYIKEREEQILKGNK